MIRVVLAVLFATALLSTGLQATETGRERHAAALAKGELAAFRTTVERFAARNDPVPPGHEGATRVVTVHVPEGVTVTVGGSPGGSDPPGRDRIAWRTGGATHALWLATDLGRGATTPDDEPLVVRSGTHRLRLSLVRVEGRPAVLVRRFRSGDGTSPPHA